VQHRAERFFLGLGKYAPNCALQGELDWKSQEQKQWLCCTRLWCRLLNMDNNRLTKCVFMWAFNKANNGIKNWLSAFKMFMQTIGMDHICELQPLFTKQILLDLDLILYEFCATKWYATLSRVEGVNGRGLNKLRTYRKFKTNLHVEHYVKDVWSKRERSAFAKFRCGVAPLHIETGRYTNVSLNERLCVLCNVHQVEDEFHVLMVCDMYTDIRNSLLECCFELDPELQHKSLQDVFIFIMSDPRMARQSAKACLNILNRRRSFMYAK